MKRNPDVLERLAPLSGAPSRGYEDLLRRRAKRELARKIGAIAVVTALIVALLGIGLGTLDDRTKPPANPPHVSHPGTFTGMVIRTGPVYDTAWGPRRSGPEHGRGDARSSICFGFPAYRPHRVGGRIRRRQMGRVREPFCDDGRAVADWERRRALGHERDRMSRVS